jgi:quercetin dioxygenase-like cupin family protein
MNATHHDNTRGLTRTRFVTAVAVACAMAAFALSGSDAAASPGAGTTTQTVGRATMPAAHLNSGQFTLRQMTPADAVTVVVTFLPGGTTGWHSHPGPVVNLVTAGTLTYYRGDDPACTPHQYAAGQGFWDEGGDVHIVRNEGTTPATLVVTFLNVPAGTAPRIDEPAPGNCPF